MGVFHGFDFQIPEFVPPPPPPAETWTLRSEQWLYDIPDRGCYRVQHSPGGWEWRWDAATGTSVGGFAIRTEDAIAAAEEHRLGKRKGVPMR